MIRPDPDYVRPAVLVLEFTVDVTVSLANNCKTTSSSNVGTSPCNGHPTRPCTSVGS